MYKNLEIDVEDLMATIIMDETFQDFFNFKTVGVYKALKYGTWHIDMALVSNGQPYAEFTIIPIDGIYKACFSAEKMNRKMNTYSSYEELKAFIVPILTVNINFNKTNKELTILIPNN
jgi:hypothetical protein